MSDCLDEVYTACGYHAYFDARLHLGYTVAGVTLTGCRVNLQTVSVEVAEVDNELTALLALKDVLRRALYQVDQKIEGLEDTVTPTKDVFL